MKTRTRLVEFRRPDGLPGVAEVPADMSEADAARLVREHLASLPAAERRPRPPDSEWLPGYSAADGIREARRDYFETRPRRPPQVITRRGTYGVGQRPPRRPGGF
jgi:hypothetical protein